MGNGLPPRFSSFRLKARGFIFHTPLNIALILGGCKRKHEDVNVSILKEGRPVLKAIVASPVHSADGLLAVIVRVPHFHFPTENHSNLTGCKPGLDVRNLLGKNVVCSSLPLTTTK